MYRTHSAVDIKLGWVKGIAWNAHVIRSLWLSGFIPVAGIAPKAIGSAMPGDLIFAIRIWSIVKHCLVFFCCSCIGGLYLDIAEYTPGAINTFLDSGQAKVGSQKATPAPNGIVHTIVDVVHARGILSIPHGLLVGVGDAKRVANKMLTTLVGDDFFAKDLDIPIVKFDRGSEGIPAIDGIVENILHSSTAAQQVEPGIARTTVVETKIMGGTAIVPGILRKL